MIVSAVALAVIFFFVDVGELINHLRLADYRLVALGTLLSLTWLLVRGMVWRTLLRNKASFATAFFSLNEGYLLNNLFPFRVGEVGRAFLLGRKANLNFWHVLSTVVIERTLDLALAAGLLLSTIPFVVGASWATQSAVLSGVIVLIGLGILYWMARFPQRAEQIANFLTGRLPFVGRLVSSRLPVFLSGLSVLTAGTVFIKAVGLLVLDWTIAVLQYYVVLLAFIPGARLIWASFALGVAALGIAAPSSPGAVGVLEASLIAALAVVRVNASVALAFAVTVHLMQYVLTGIFGIYALSRDGETLTGLYQSARGMLKRSSPG